MVAIVILFATINELKRRIREVWDECANPQSNETVSPPFGSR